MDYAEALSVYKQASDKLGKPYVECAEQDECLRKLILWAIRSPEYPGRLNAGILLRGRRDTGKTHAFRCLQKLLAEMNGAYRMGGSFNVKVCQDIVTDYNNRGEEALDFRSDGYFATLFDDLGEERDGNFMGKSCVVMAEVIQARYRRMQTGALVTMFTTNLPDDAAMTFKYGERVTTRLDEMCDIILWKGPAEGYRKKVDPLPWTWEVNKPAAPRAPVSPEEAERNRQTMAASLKEMADRKDFRLQEEKRSISIKRFTQMEALKAKLPRMTVAEIVAESKLWPMDVEALDLMKKTVADRLPPGSTFEEAQGAA